MGWLAFTWRQLYLFWIGPIASGLVFLYFVRDEPSLNEKDSVGDEPGEAEGATTLLTRNFMLYISSRGVRMFAGSMVGAFLSIYLIEAMSWTLVEIGIMYSASSLLGLVASPVGGYAATRVGEKRWAVISFTLGFTCFFMAFLTRRVYPFMALYLAYRFFSILSMPALASITARMSPSRQMGMGYAISFMPSSITGIAAPMVAAWIADSYGLAPIFSVATAVMYLSLMILQLGVRFD
jgi:MFS family permease